MPKPTGRTKPSKALATTAASEDDRESAAPNVLDRITGSPMAMWALSVATAVAFNLAMWQIFDNRSNFSKLNRLEREAKLYS